MRNLWICFKPFYPILQAIHYSFAQTGFVTSVCLEGVIWIIASDSSGRSVPFLNILLQI